MNKYPFVTIIMPIYNEAHYISRCLNAVLAQDYPHNRMEVLIIDGGSQDATRAIIQRTIAAQPVSRPAVSMLDNPLRIIPKALNIGLQQARGEIVIRVDGHCEIAKEYVRRCVEALCQTGADNVGGLQRAVGQSWVGRAVARATSSPFGVGNARFHYTHQAGWADSVYLGAYRREVFERIGTFDEALAINEDDEFNFRLLRSGGKIWLDPSICSLYFNRSSLQKLWQQYFRYGLYKVLVIQKHAAVPAPRHLIPATFVLGLFGSLCITCLTRNPRWILSIVGPYAIVNGLASIWCARRDWGTLPLLPIVFLILHCAYGTGFLQGIWRWRYNIANRSVKA